MYKVISIKEKISGPETLGGWNKLNAILRRFNELTQRIQVQITGALNNMSSIMTAKTPRPEEDPEKLVLGVTLLMVQKNALGSTQLLEIKRDLGEYLDTVMKGEWDPDKWGEVVAGIRIIREDTSVRLCIDLVQEEYHLRFGYVYLYEKEVMSELLDPLELALGQNLKSLIMPGSGSGTMAKIISKIRPGLKIVATELSDGGMFDMYKNMFFMPNKNFKTLNDSDDYMNGLDPSNPILWLYPTPDMLEGYMGGTSSKADVMILFVSELVPTFLSRETASQLDRDYKVVEIPFSGAYLKNSGRLFLLLKRGTIRNSKGKVVLPRRIKEKVKTNTRWGVVTLQEEYINEDKYRKGLAMASKAIKKYQANNA